MAKRTEVIVLAMEKHGKHVIKRLQSIFDDSAMCDVTLTAGDLSIQAHKVVLAANSDYFQAMFSGNWSEKHDSNIVLEELTPRGLRAVVEFSYHGKLTVDCENIIDIVSAIHHCQLVKACKLCEEYLCDEIDETNFLDFLKISNTFSLEKLRDELVDFAMDELMPSSCLSTEGSDACSLVNKLDASFLLEVIKRWDFFSTGIGRCAATDVVMKWAKYDCEAREKYVSELLQTLNVMVMGEDGSCSSEFDVNTARSYCELTSEEKIHDAQTGGLSLVSMFVHSSRLDIDFLVAYNIDTKSYRQLPICLGVSGSCSITSLNNALYVFGGGKEGHHKYDTCLDRWFEIQPMQESRSNFALVALQDRLVALGGRGNTDIIDHNNLVDHTVEIYDPHNDTWSYGVPLPKVVFGHAAATHGRCIYVSGGCSKQQGKELPPPTNQMFCYEPKQKSWTEKANMITRRYGHQLVAHGDRLYQLNGVIDNIFSDRNPGVEYYDIPTNTWTVVDIFSQDYNAHPLGASVDNMFYMWYVKYWEPNEGEDMEEDYLQILPRLHIATFDPETKNLAELYEEAHFYQRPHTISELIPLNIPSHVVECLPLTDHLF